jgi:exopolysaccharide biosynthesis polyprenyl glycosylphosphotransferase
MIKERETALERMSVLFQVGISLLCFIIVLWYLGSFNADSIVPKNEFLVIAFLIIPIWFVLLELFELGEMTRIQNYMHLLKRYVLVISLGAISIAIFARIFDFEWLTPKVIIMFSVFNFFVLAIEKVTNWMILRYFRRKGYNSRMILIIADESSSDFIKQIIETAEWGYRIWGIMTTSPQIRWEFGDRYPIYSEDEDFAQLIDEKVIDEVFYCKQDFNTRSIKELIRDCREVGVSFYIHNKVLSFSGLSPKLYFLNHQFFLSFRNTPDRYFATKVKGIIDFFLSAIILILISPFMLAIAVAIKLDDGGPVFFNQIRVGRHGRLFNCLKYRTMVTNAEELKEKIMDLNEQEGPVFKIKNDPRVTRVGRFLRKTSLDELPQFLNVLMGDMSIVGPRPPIPSEVKQYKRELKRRLSINPGITCIWQVSGRNSIPFEKWMEMDMEYIDNWSLMLDFVIMLKTFKVIFARNGQ